MARKREERATKESQKKEKKEKSGANKEDEHNLLTFNHQLATMGLELREVPGDGNCLFRALGDQLEGHTNNHLQHREDTVEYMRQYRKDFEPFVEDDVPFDKHVRNLQKAGTYAGNDAIVAFARRNGVTVVIHQLNSPLWKIHGGDPNGKNHRELHIAYHNGDHYNSVRRIGDDSAEPANIHLSVDKAGNSHQQQKQLKINGTIYKENQNGGEKFSDTEDNEDEENLMLFQKVQLVMERTGCNDPVLVEQTLEEQQMNLEAATDFIVQMMILSQPNSEQESSSPLWKEDGTGKRIFGDLQNGVGDCGAKQKPYKHAHVHKFEAKKHLTNKQRKHLKRQERKLNNELWKKQKHLTSSSDSDENTTTVIQQLGCLNI